MRKHRRRRSRQGIALTEALIAICMLIILFAGLSYLHAVYSAKTASMQQARMLAWGGTRFDCKGTQAHGAASVAVHIPFQLRSSAEGQAQRSVGTKADLVCNIKPDQSDDVIGVLAWAGGAAAQGLSTEAVSAVAGEIRSGIADAVIGAAKDLVDKINPFD